MSADPSVRNRLPDPPLLVVTDRRQARRPLEAVAEAAFSAGCRWLSLREKDLPPAERLALLRRLVAIGARWGATVGVHDDLAAAAAIPALALHLPAGEVVAAARAVLGPARLIGRSAHAGDDLSGPAVEGADYLTMSPFRLTPSKPGYGPALGPAGLSVAAARCALPILALGGIGPADVAPCLAAGATGVAVMGGVMRAHDPAAAVAALLRGFADRAGQPAGGQEVRAR